MAAAIAAPGPVAGDGPAGTSAPMADDSATAFDTAYLEDPENVAEGRALWEQQCRHCHGRSAYPGKAPKLKPRKYSPQFVFDRVTNGFRKMPPWKDVFSDAQRRAIVAWVLSEEFSP